VAVPTAAPFADQGRGKVRVVSSGMVGRALGRDRIEGEGKAGQGRGRDPIEGEGRADRAWGIDLQRDIPGPGTVVYQVLGVDCWGRGVSTGQGVGWAES